jgi:hypothetical protein
MEMFFKVSLRTARPPSPLLMLTRETVAVCSENINKHGNTICGQNVVKRMLLKQPLGFQGLGISLFRLFKYLQKLSRL